MQILSGGPSLAALRRSVGTDKPVQFGSGKDAFPVVVEMLCAAGTWDLPVHMPSRSMDMDCAWVVAGKAQFLDREVTVMIIYVFLERARLCAVVFDDDVDSTALTPYLPLAKMFARKAAEQIQFRDDDE